MCSTYVCPESRLTYRVKHRLKPIQTEHRYAIVTVAYAPPSKVTDEIHPRSQTRRRKTRTCQKIPIEVFFRKNVVTAGECLTTSYTPLVCSYLRRFINFVINLSVTLTHLCYIKHDRSAIMTHFARENPEKLRIMTSLCKCMYDRSSRNLSQ